MSEAAKTIRARIKIAVWPDGSWTAYGDHTKSAGRTMDGTLQPFDPWQR